MNEMVTKEAAKEVSSALAMAQAQSINSDDDFALVDSNCVGLLKLKKRIESDFADSKATTYAAWKAVVAQEKGHLDGIDEARRIYKTKMDEWSRKHEAIRQAEEARLQAEAKARAEKEALDRAVAMEAAGQTAEADAIMQEPIEAPIVVVPKTAPKSQTVIRKVWKYRVVNPNIVPREYLAIDEKKVGGVVRSLGGATNIPGIQTYQENV